MAQDIEHGERSTQETLNKDRLLVKWFCLDLGPFDMLKYNGFRKYVEDENYTLPTMKTFSEEVVTKQYDTARSELKKTFDLVHHVAITIETWKWGVSSRIRGRKMWTATVHFVHQGKFLSQTLFTIEIKVKTAKKIANELRKILCEWGIFHKVVCFVTNHENNEHSLCYGVIDDLKIPNICCAASALNLDMQEVLSYLKYEEIKKRYLTYNSEMSKKKKAEPFSWHIPYTVLKEINEGNTCDFNAIELKEISECVQILKPFEDFTNKLSSEQYITLSHIIPLTVGMKLKITKLSPTTKMGCNLKEKLEKAIELNFGIKENNLIQIAEKASFMDPRFKRAGFITIENANSVQADVIKELTERVNICKQHYIEASSSNNLSEEETTAIDSGNLLFYLEERVKYSGSDNNSLHARFNVEQYVNMPYIYHNSNHFQFWDDFKGLNTYHSELLKMSQKYLCIPATAIPVESISGEFLYKRTNPNSINYNERRNLLDLERINEILFLHSYYSRNPEFRTDSIL